MTLRSGVTFTDGTTFDADAVKANLEHDIATPGPFAARLSLVTSVETKGSDTVVLQLSAPNPSLPLTFAETLGMMASPKALAGGQIAQDPVGAGPYKLDASKTVVNDHYTFVKNDDYWDAKNIGYTTLVMRVIPDTNAIFSAIQSGQLDMGIGTASTAAAAKSAGISVLDYSSIFYNLQLLDRDGKTVPALGQQKVRQALNYAIDRKSIAKSVLVGRATDQMFQPGQDGYDKSLDGYYSYDLDKAKQLMADAGYADGFSVTVLSTPGITDTLVQAIAASWEKIGVKVDIDSKAPADYAAAKLKGVDPIVMSANTPTDSYLDAQLWLVETASQNIYKTHDDQIQSLWTQGASQDQKGRDATYKKLSKRTIELAWFAPIVQGLNYWYYRDSVTGVHQTVGESYPYIYDWKPTGK
jgi:peptide/nickel transport system substrate-binding protein